MSILNIEIKARCNDPNRIRTIIKKKGADFKGTDHQIDTYFDVPEGRLKLRRGAIEQNLIFYRRSDTKEPKASDINLVPAEHPERLHNLLDNALGTKVVVDKEREIYFIDNVKFHIDRVKKLGNFVEIEAIDEDGNIGKEKLHEQCQKYLELFEITDEQLVAESYSDLLMNLDSN
ncbi:class IV adenylate cyclase [Fodinibius halophilus]|uniref:Class IV adenylate cyclase n=1 Tax=Fodinibius halophilus TaxID=1736908 RepID=A0A6M1TL47_9BACT|nr:class IV adenylate cyclase [Fodinibius halophilus]NGP89200.1 class IV adenylate cyclase [Fodinibius halophilus]